jgi:thiol-disulfide isomerase/thioredoxin
VRAVAVVLIVLAAAGNAGSQDPTNLHDLLEAVEKNYRNAKSYLFEVEVRTEVNVRGGFPAASESKVLLAGRRPGSFHFESHGDDEFVTISNGRTTWVYSSRVRQYTQEDVAFSESAAGGDSAQGADDQVSRMTAMLVGDFTHLLGSMERVSILREEDIKISGGKARCRVAQIAAAPAGKGPGPVREMWIDAARSRVLKLVIRGETVSSERGPMQYRQLVTYKAVRINEELPEALFTFTPPKNAKLVEFVNVAGSQTASLLGKPAPEIALKTLDGEAINLSRLRGSVVLLDFWASWCPPCRAELPAIAKLREDYGEKGLVVLGVNDEGNGIAKSYLQSAHLTLPTLDDHKQTTHNDYRIRAIPTVILINRDGVVIKHLRGSLPAEELREGLKAAGL